MSSPSNPSGGSKGTAISAFDKLDEATLAFQQNRHADLSSILTEVPQHLSKLISHAAHLKEKCQDARTLFKNVIHINLEVIASMRDDNSVPPPPQSENEQEVRAICTVSMPEERIGDLAVIQEYVGRPGSPRMVIDVTERAGDIDKMKPPRIVRDGVNDAATFALRHYDFLKLAHDAQDGIYQMHFWAIVFRFEEERRHEGALNYVRRVRMKSKDVQERSYTKNGPPFTAVISGVVAISDIEDQNRTLRDLVLLADLFISFYSDMVQTLQFVHDNLDSFRTVHRKLSEEKILVAPNGAERRDMLKQAVMATAEAYDAVKNMG